jgi:hypothetical protein
MSILFSDQDAPNILDNGFNKNLTRDSSLGDVLNQSTPEVENVISDGVAPKGVIAGEINAPVSMVAGHMQSSNFVSGVVGWQIKYDGTAEFQNVNIGQKILTIDDTQDIGDALDILSDNGGGVLNLKAGTYTINSALTGISNIQIIGESSGTTILDFNNTAANLSFAGTNVYATGTITGITSGVSVTGSGTSWLANASAGQYLFISTQWYLIAAVTSDTTLILAEAYGDDITFPIAYRIATVKRNIFIKQMLIKNSTGTALTFTDCREINLSDILFVNNDVGLASTNCSLYNATRILATSSFNNGIEVTNIGRFTWTNVVVVGNGAYGLVFDNIKTGAMIACTSSGNQSGGFVITNAEDIGMWVEASANGGYGIEMGLSNDNIEIFNAIVDGNSSDGVNLDTNTDNVKFYGSEFVGNGGYGINIAAAGCNGTIITTNTFSGNVTSACNDSGTGTVIRGNVGLSDNGVSGSSSITGSFTAGENLTANDLVIVAGGEGTLVDSDTTNTTDHAITTSTWKSQLFTTASDSISIPKVILYLTNTTGFGSTVTISIRANSAGAPTGVDIGGYTASASVPNGANGEFTFTFTTPVPVSTATDYHVVAFSNLGNPGDQWRGGNAGGNGSNTSTDSGANWSAENGPLYHKVYHINRIVGDIYRADASVNDELANNIIGFAGATTTLGNMVVVTIGGIKASMTGLTAGSTYYASDTTGAISTSAGSQSRKVGRALSTTQMLVVPTLQ